MTSDAPTHDTTILPLDSVICGDALETLRGLPDASIDAIVTDPPAGIAFMGKDWDAFRRTHNPADVGRESVHGRMSAHAPHSYGESDRGYFIETMRAIFEECLRVLKPGGHALVWALPRTSHWTGTALEDAGFECRDVISHWFGSGFPKSHNLTGEWEGWGTALKPAAEFWWLCRKPLSEGTVAANVLAHGVGALNIEASRVGSENITTNGWRNTTTSAYQLNQSVAPDYRGDTRAGRWPANLLLSHAPSCGPQGCALWCPVRELDAQSGTLKTGKPTVGSMATTTNAYGQYAKRSLVGGGDTGGASRYFATFKYQAKASRSERNHGCEAMGDGEARAKAADYRPNDPHENTLQTRLHGSVERRGNHHPTVKPLALMSWLIGLITPPHGIVLDCFAGSGSTLVAAKEGGWRYIGIEREQEYVAIIQARLNATQEGAQETATAETHREEVEPISIGSAVTLSSSSHATPAPTRQKPAKPAKPTATRRKRPQPTITDSLQPSLFDTGTYLVWLKHVEQESPSA